MVDQGEPRRVTYASAGEILGVSKSTVSTYVAQGLLDTLGPSGPGVPTLELDQVRALARRRREASRTRRRRTVTLHYRQPPDLDHDWLTLAQVTALVGVTRSAISQRCRRGTIPFTEHAGQRWFRRDLIETWLLARRAQAERYRGAQQLPPGT